jgi:hypothetical protein
MLSKNLNTILKWGGWEVSLLFTVFGLLKRMQISDVKILWNVVCM